MWQRSLQPKVITCNALISASTGYDEGEIHAAIGELWQHGLQLMSSLTALFLCIRHGWDDGVTLQFSDEMRLQGLQPSVTTYSARSRACERRRMTVRAWQLLDGLRRHESQPDD